MSKAQQLGRFILTSPQVVVTDPGYDTATAGIEGLGCFVSPCDIGEWNMDFVPETAPKWKVQVPRTLLAVRDGFLVAPDPAEWQRVGEGIGGDSGLIGVFDLARFHDAALVPGGQQWTFDGGPADPTDLWFSFVCEAIGKQKAAVVPHGFVVYWDGGMDVDTLLYGGKVCAIRLSISGWPDAI
jgi:hypothetical protein